MYPHCIPHLGERWIAPHRWDNSRVCCLIRDSPFPRVASGFPPVGPPVWAHGGLDNGVGHRFRGEL